MDKIIILLLFILYLILRYFYEDYKLKKEIEKSEEKMIKLHHPKYGKLSMNKEFYIDCSEELAKLGWIVDKII